MGMGRYRPPKPKASPYITREGYEAKKDELEALWKKRRVVVDALAAAAAEGDRSENAEYIYRKKQLGGIDYRIRFLQKRIPDLKVVDEAPSNQEKVFFGAWIELEDEEGKEVTYRIVGPDEFDEKEEYISMDSLRVSRRPQLDPGCRSGDASWRDAVGRERALQPVPGL